MLGNLHIWHLLRPAVYPFLFMITQLTQACKKKNPTGGRPPLEINFYMGSQDIHQTLKVSALLLLNKGNLWPLLENAGQGWCSKGVAKVASACISRRKRLFLASTLALCLAWGKYSITKSIWANFLRYCVAPCSLKRRRRLGLDSESLKCMKRGGRNP